MNIPQLTSLQSVHKVMIAMSLGGHPILADDVDVLIACAKIIAIVLVGAAGALLLRRWVKSDSTSNAPPAGFSLSDLRQLRDSGQMSPEEYERARQKIIDAAKRVPIAPKPDPANPFGPPRV